MINDLKDPQLRAGKSKSFVSNVIKRFTAFMGLGGNAVVSLFSGLLASALILYSGYVLYDTFYVQNQAYSAWDVLREYKPDLSDIDNDKVPQETWEAMQEIIKNYRAWITVYDTTIDYPVVQGEDDVYYAHNDIYGDPSLTGAIYLATANSYDFGDNYNVIYGHHMDNGAMFGALDEFKNDDFFNEHREGILVTKDKIYDFKIFGVLGTDAYENKVYNIGGDRKIKDIVEFIKDNAIQYDEETAGKASKILALSTCVSALTDGRLVVFAALEGHPGEERNYINPTDNTDNPKDAGPADGGNKYYNVYFFRDPDDTDSYLYERVPSDTKATAPDAPEKEGYTFAYWGDQFGNRFDFDTLITSNRNLYAYYNANQYTVTYYNEDGSTVVDAKTVNAGSNAENLAIPAKDGYYAYWSDRADGDTEFDFTKPVNGETKLYIVYKPVPKDDCSVKYYDENGNLIEEKTVGGDEGFKAEKLDIPEKDGYEAYWSRTPDGDSFDFNTVLENDIELYIVYKPVTDKGTQGGTGGSGGGNGSGMSDGGNGGDGNGDGDGDGNGDADGDGSKNPIETIIDYFKPTGTSYNVNGRPAWALVNLIALILTIYILFPVLHLKAKYGRGKMMEKVNEQKKELWKAKELREREKFVREGIYKQALENRKKANDGATPLVQVEITEDEFDTAVEDLYYKVKKFLRRFRIGIVMEAIISVAALITFILTEDMRLPMILIDRWTPLMLLFLLCCWLTDVILARYRKKTEDGVEYPPEPQDGNPEEKTKQETKVH